MYGLLIRNDDVNSPHPPTQYAWQQELAQAFTRLDDLLEFIKLDPHDVPALAGSFPDFPLKVTRSFAKRIRKNDPSDPLLLQILPTSTESAIHGDFVSDPVGDINALAVPGLLHKYQGRVLLIATGACAVHCRYCFRRDFSYGEYQMSRRRETDVLNYIRSDQSVQEVILSGGDPLTMSDDRLASLLTEIADITHITRVRIHTRLPVVLPSRITDRLLDAISTARTKIILVIHANHANEFDQGVKESLGQLKDAGVVLLNQTVLLKGINDSSPALCELSEALFDAGVLPYYLHVLDKAVGTQHFDVSTDKALAIHNEIRAKLPGYLVPRLVREEEGQPYKTLLGVY